MSASIDNAVTELRNASEALVVARNNASDASYKLTEADRLFSEAQQRYDSARVSLVQAAEQPTE